MVRKVGELYGHSFNFQEYKAQPRYAAEGADISIAMRGYADMPSASKSDLSQVGGAAWAAAEAKNVLKKLKP